MSVAMENRRSTYRGELLGGSVSHQQCPFWRITLGDAQLRLFVVQRTLESGAP